MSYRILDLDIPSDNPFVHDALDRKPVVEFLADLIGRTGGPFVLALDSPWGSGKTTIVRMLDAELSRQDFQCVYFNAWNVDYVTDPLVALVSSIDQIELADQQASISFKKHLKTVKNATSLVAKRGAVAVAKALTLGILDVDTEIAKAIEEFSGDIVNDLVDSFQKEKEILKKFHDELEAAVGQLPNAGKKPTLVFFIDELDRCRPTFAIELLERIKHLFDVPNITFVLSIDKSQLEASTAAVYGQGINAIEYLRRFIDLEYGIPQAKGKKFVESLFARFGLDAIFSLRVHPELNQDRAHFIDLFAALADAIQMSLRAQERCMTRLRVVMDQTPPDHYLDPLLVAVLIVLRSTQVNLFNAICTAQASASELVSYLQSLPGGPALINSRLGHVIEAYFIARDKNTERKTARIAKLEEIVNNDNLPMQERKNAEGLMEFIAYYGRHRQLDISLSSVARKIELSASLNP